MRTHRVPYIDQRQKHAAPKADDGPGRDNEARPNGIPLYECRNSQWKPWQSLKMSAACGDSGTADERVAWRCPDCGLEIDCEHESCERCGSSEPAELR